MVFLYLAVVAVIIYVSGLDFHKVEIPNSKIAIELVHANDHVDNNPHHIIMTKFIELLEKNKNIQIDRNSQHQIHDEQRVMQNVMSNVFQVGIISTNSATVFSPTLGILDLPYLFEDEEECRHVLEDLKEEFTTQMINESGVRPLGFAVQGFRIIANNVKPIRKIEDLKGLKIRVPVNPIQVATFEEWEVNPVSMGTGEAYIALQKGLIDGLEMTYAELVGQNIYSMQKYYMEMRYKLTIDVIVVPNLWYEGLPKDVQADLQHAAREATSYSNTKFEILEREGKKTIQKNGGLLAEDLSCETNCRKRLQKTWSQYDGLIKNPNLLEKVQRSIKEYREN